MAVYITYNQPLRYRQLTFEDIMAGFQVDDMEQLKIGDGTGTRTVCVNHVPKVLATNTDVLGMIEKLKSFNIVNKELHDVDDKQSLYYTFHCLKKSGHGFREINAPEPRLKNAQRSLKDLLSSFMFADYHTSAFAYVKHRSTISAVKKHQEWGSRWFVKFDLSDFFGSHNINYLIACFERIYPFNLILMNDDGRQELTRALTLCFLNEKLPQGTPISPFLTNVAMIPFDHKVTNALHNFDMGGGRTERFIYTRYADDMHISCRVDFDYKKIEQFIIDSLAWMNAPFKLNREKTHYGNSNGKNWMLGVMLNKDNQITIGHKAKRELKASVYNYLMDRKNGNPWNIEDVRTLRGLISYYISVEGDVIINIINEKSNEVGMNYWQAVEEDLNNIILGLPV